MTALWILIAYTVGTLFGYLLNLTVRKQFFMRGVAFTIDSLIDTGYLRANRGDDGEIHLIKAED